VVFFSSFFNRPFGQQTSSAVIAPLLNRFIYSPLIIRLSDPTRAYAIDSRCAFCFSLK
jgi:hypothetical protein